MFLSDPDVTLYHGDVLATLRDLPAESVDCVVTSPPYWGLRDYGQEGQLGLEPTPEQYVERMVEVFRELRRVLAPHGTCWVNLGDSYSGSWSGHSMRPEGGSQRPGKPGFQPLDSRVPARPPNVPGLKPKDLVGIPWRVAFALQADGWYLRSDIVWSKPNPMPESVTDRPTKAHEMVFLLAKGQWKARVVALADLHGEVMHLGNHVGSHDPNVWAHQFGVGLASAILDSAKLQQEFTLPPLDAEVWKELYGGGDGKTIRYLPVEHRALMYASAFRTSHVSAKEFLCELDRLGISLTDGKHFKVVGGTTEIAFPPTINRYGETAIAIHDSGEIGEIDFATHTVKCSRPSGCSYFFDQEAVREAWTGRIEPVNGPGQAFSPEGRPASGSRARGPDGRSKTIVQGADGSIQHRDGERWPNGGRNIRSVWEIATQPYPEAHFATFPEELARRAIAAGCPEQVCRVCGKARERIVEVESSWRSRAEMGAIRGNLAPEGLVGAGTQRAVHGAGVSHDLDSRRREIVGWSECACVNFGPDTEDGDLGEVAPKYRPGIVLDPFMGSGTVAYVARKLGRHAVGIDLSAEYLELAARRLQQQSLFAETA